MLNVPKEIEVCGALEVGIPSIGNYSHVEFMNLNGFTNSRKFSGVTYDTVKNLGKECQKLKVLGYLGLKYHPRSFQDNFFSRASKSLIRACGDLDLIYGICTYESDCLYSSRFNYELRETIDCAILNNLKIILFHGGGQNFDEFYSIYGKQCNVFFDCSFSLLRFKRKDFLAKVIEVLNNGAENIGFGSDYPDYCIKDYQDTLNDIIENVNFKNFKKFISDNSLSFIGGAGAK